MKTMNLLDKSFKMMLI